MRRLVTLAAAAFIVPCAIQAQSDVCPATRNLKPAGTAGPVSPAEVCRVLSALAADSMEGRGTGTPGSAKAARFIAAEFKAAGLEAGGDSGYFQKVPLENRPGNAVNVVGILRGADPVLKDSVVLVDAHYDHLGMRPSAIDVDSAHAYALAAAPIMAERAKWAQDNGVSLRRRGGAPMTDAQRAKVAEFQARIDAIRVNMDSLRRAIPVPHRDSIYNGADDDASGTTAVIEIAKQLARGPRPKRTIVFAATTGEEVGLIGTNWYLKHPALPLTSMEANLEIEMIGRPDSLAGGPGKAWLTGFERSTMGSMFAKAGLAVVPDKRPEQSFFTRSDNIAFARMGIPAHTLSSFNLHSDYHQLTDEVRFVDFAHMAGVINIGVQAVGILANGPAPVWNPGGKP